MTSLAQHVSLIKQANKITNRKTLYSIGAGLIPIPIVDTATLLGIQLTMIQSIGNLYSIPFKKHVAKSLIGSLISSISSVGLIKLVPGLGTVLGGASAAAAGAASTYALGRVFTQHFDQGGTLLDFDPILSREYFHKEFEAGRLFVAEQNLVDSNTESYVITEETPKSTKVILLEETEVLRQSLLHLQQDIDSLQSQNGWSSKPKKNKPKSTQTATLTLSAKKRELTNNLSDFTIIEGVGPKIDSILKQAGIDDMDTLSKTNLNQLQQILKDAGGKFNFADPSTWAEQASLAAAGQMKELEVLQKKLINGKKK